MASEIAKAIQYLCDEKDLDFEIVLEALQTALGAAYRKDFGNRQGNYQVKFDVETGDMEIWDEKEVAEDVDEELLGKAQEEMSMLREKARYEDRELSEEEVAHLPQFNPKTQIMLREAKEVKKNVKIGEILKIPQEIPHDFGRMAAMTAKQVIIQKIREAERNSVFVDFQDQAGKIVQGVIHKRDRSGTVLVDLGKIIGVLNQNEQIRRDQYRPGVKMKFFVVSVGEGSRGPEILLSRSSTKMVQAVFAQEVPEIVDGDVEIKKIARDAGNRSKIAVFTEDDSIDPIGACIGQRGSRINTIIEELGGEKIDIIQWSDKPETYIKNALSPAKVVEIELNEESREAIAKVEPDQFSLAIGRGGQNVRLAAELTEWKINVADLGGEQEVSSEDDEEVMEKVLTGESKDLEGEKDAEALEEVDVVKVSDGADNVAVEIEEKEENKEDAGEVEEDKEDKEEKSEV
ncbi:MAG: transcription termination/antitermination protein NusA [Candidatus Magasanikbacteria bacterium CG_4_10_14_0_2_um_filter_37_12]|uniref:Transcription termination/antitermination protein NusA n=1 Tax=Candidatus Magasanikbacteria bacterium CG_4_10_14_0_2_um_filter_37_12 TaxID=1974637 RepID=A0A2M7V9P2_9BACT|nr:MAG: transcription termination/antitermination protein NusA [Candidatus Magasanikbacteria bacterium CG_4_10_14_0_2_um_filter_37_12]